MKEGSEHLSFGCKRYVSGIGTVSAGTPDPVFWMIEAHCQWVQDEDRPNYM